MEKEGHSALHYGGACGGIAAFVQLLSYGRTGSFFQEVQCEQGDFRLGVDRFSEFQVSLCVYGRLYHCEEYIALQYCLHCHGNHIGAGDGAVAQRDSFQEERKGLSDYLYAAVFSVLGGGGNRCDCVFGSL